jgi:hypothetical protein
MLHIKGKLISYVTIPILYSRGAKSLFCTTLLYLWLPQIDKGDLNRKWSLVELCFSWIFAIIPHSADPNTEGESGVQGYIQDIVLDMSFVRLPLIPQYFLPCIHSRQHCPDFLSPSLIIKKYWFYEWQENGGTEGVIMLRPKVRCFASNTTLPGLARLIHNDSRADNYSLTAFRASSSTISLRILTKTASEPP